MKLLSTILFILCLGLIVIISCRPSQQIVDKGGAQLWSENCVRCHYAPSPTDYSDSQWDLISTHMQLRAQLTATEKEKILEFLKTAN